MAALRPYFNHLYAINLLKSIDYRGPTPLSQTGPEDAGMARESEYPVLSQIDLI